jgi:hypothetical protein
VPPSPTDGKIQPSSSPSTLPLVVDASLEASLPERIGTIQYERHSLAPGGSPPIGFTDDIGRALLRAADSTGTLSVAWSVPTVEASDPQYRVSFLAIRVPRANARNLRDVMLFDRILVPGFSGMVKLSSLGPVSVLLVGKEAIASSGDTLYLLSYPMDERGAAPSPGPDATPPFTSDQFYAALPATDPEPAPQPPSLPAVPSVAPGTSPPPDGTAEALLPDRIRDSPVAKVSGRGPGLFQGEWIHLGIPAYLLASELGLDLGKVSAAGGHPNGISTFFVVATPLPGFEAREILSAWFRPQLSDGLPIEAIEANGRVALLYGNQAVYAEDGVFYWMAYLDIGDRLTESPEPRPALKDLVADTLRVLP